MGHDELEAALDDPDIQQRLVVTPLLDPSQVGEASIDVRLGTEFLLLRRTLEAGIDPGEQPAAVIEGMQDRLLRPVGSSIWLHPRHFVLASTLEYIRLPDTMGAYVIGRSSWGRVGLLVATAVMVHPGFTGSLTLELVNEGDSPIRLYPGSRIAQLAVHRMGEPTSRPYGDDVKYAQPIGPEPSRLTKERDEIQRLSVLADALESRLT